MKRLELLLFASLVVALKMVAQPTVYSLEFNPDKYTVQTYTFDDKEYQVRAFENIVYVANPVDTVYQKMNIYVPEEYFHGKTLGRYDRESAPIFLPNGIGGYMPSGPMTLSNQSARNIFGQREGGRQGGSGRPQGMPQPLADADMKQGSAIHYALAHGYVVASPGARGRSLQNSAGVYTGKAPAGLVDLKAAIRYLKYNDKHIPGNKERIISNGTSAGGAMSTLLGATGNSNDYAPYLLELGAAKATDNILAVSAYCPITNLNHADCAYEWQFNGINTYEAGMMRFLDGTNSNAPTSNELTPLQIKTSNELKTQFPIYLNSLKLKDQQGNLLVLDAEGNGNFKEYVIYWVLKSAQTAMDQGKDLSNIAWLTIKDGKAVGLDMDAYVRHMQRMKTPPAFDAFTMDAPENHLFGTASLPAQHFTEFSYKNSPDGGTLAAAEIIKMMNPMDYIDGGVCQVAPYWHIRYGSIDNNTSLAIEIILATYLQNNGYEVDFALAWDRPHMGDYDLDELFKWMDEAVYRSNYQVE